MLKLWKLYDSQRKKELIRLIQMRKIMRKYAKPRWACTQYERSQKRRYKDLYKSMSTNYLNKYIW